MGHVVKYSGIINVTTAAATVSTTDTPTFTGQVVEVTIGPRPVAISSSNMMIVGRGSSDDVIIKPGEIFASTATIYSFAPKKSVNLSNTSGGTVAQTSGAVPLAFEGITLVDERVTISVASPASSAPLVAGDGADWAFSIRVDGTMPSTTP